MFMEPQIALVSIKGPITDNAYDKALFFNGEYLISADSDWKQFESIEMLAENLAKANAVDVTEIDFGVAESGWRWLDIRNELRAFGQLVGALKEYVLEHSFINEDGRHHSGSVHLNATDFNSALKKLIDIYTPMDSHLMSVNQAEMAGAPTLYQTSESEYQMAPQKGNACWITVGNVSVCVRQKENGVLVRTFPVGGEDGQELSSTYAGFKQLIKETA
jgi:hypothetical protein